MDEFIEYKNGGYRAEVKFANEETNYQLPSVASAIFTMKRLSINIPTSDKTNFVYNGKAQTYVITPNEYYTVTGNIQTNAGEYKVYVALNNASVQWADSTVQAKEYSFIIQKKVISFDGFEFEGQTFTYDGTAKSIYAKNVPADIEVTYSGNNQVEPGNYEVVLSLNYDHTNYSLDYAINGNTISKKMIILQKVVSSNNTALKDTVLVEPTLGLDISFSLRVNRIATAEYSSVRLEDGEVVLYGYSIGMLKDSLSVEYENEVKIKLKLPTDYNDRTFKIIDMNGNVIESEIDEQYIVFSSKLGSFLLVEIVPEVVDEPINLIWLIAVFGVISLGEIIFYSVYQAKRKKKGVM